MIINGTPRQACSALIDDLRQPIRLEPLTKFPLVRDLKVDRTLLFDALKKTHAWMNCLPFLGHEKWEVFLCASISG